MSDNSDAPSSSFGFTLQFVEIEILRAIYYYELTEVTSIFDYMNLKYTNLNLSKSQFYRIVEKLERTEFIESEKSGKSKILTCAEKGTKELEYFMVYVYGFLRDNLFMSEVLTELIDQVTPHWGCMRDMKIMSIGPYPIDLYGMQEMCKNCANPSKIKDNELQIPIFIALPDVDSSFFEDELKVQVIETKNPFDLLPKDNSVDIIFQSLTFYKYKDERILEEIHRIIKPGKPVLMFEPTNTVPSIVKNIMNQLLMQTSTENPNAWIIDSKENLDSPDNLKKTLEKYFSSVNLHPEFPFTLFVCTK